MATLSAQFFCPKSFEIGQCVSRYGNFIDSYHNRSVKNDFEEKDLKVWES